MGPHPRQHGVKVFVAGLILFYVLFIAEFGERSFGGHVLQILKTAESRELGRQIVDKVTGTASVAKRRVELAFDD